MLVWYMLWPFVRLSICQKSGILWKRLNIIITETAPHVRQGTLVFICQTWWYSTGATTYWAPNNMRHRKNYAFFSTNNSYLENSSKDRRFLWKVNGKSYAFSCIVTLPMTLTDPNHSRSPLFLSSGSFFISLEWLSSSRGIFTMQHYSSAVYVVAPCPSICLNIRLSQIIGVEGQLWYHGWEAPGCFLWVYLREAFQSQTNTEKILYNKSR